MSIPIRLWRILRGRLIQVRERTNQTLSEVQAETEFGRVRERLNSKRAHTDAARELGQDVASRRARSDDAGAASDQRSRSEGRSSAGAPPGTVPRPGGRDPFAEDWALLQVSPGSDLETLEASYQARLAETAPDRFPAGSPERTGAERRTAALSAAYERLRDALNTTETRFEKLEF